MACTVWEACPFLGLCNPVIQQQQGALASDSLALLTSGVTAAVEEAFTSLGEIN